MEPWMMLSTIESKEQFDNHGFKAKRKLGRGAFGDVYEVCYKTYTVAAIKYIEMKSNKITQATKKEVINLL